MAKAKVIPPSEVDDKVIDPAAQFKDVVPVPDETSLVDEEVLAEAQAVKAAADEAKAEKAYQSKKFKVRVPVNLAIGGVHYSAGSVYEVDRGTMEMITEMADRKRRADLSVFTGKNHLVQRLLDNTLKITEVETLDFRKL